MMPARPAGAASATPADSRRSRRRALRRSPPAGPGRGAPRVRLRDLTPADGPALQAVFDGLSDASRYLRFHRNVARLSDEVRAALLDVDGDDHVALIAEVRQGGAWMPAGIGHLIHTGHAVGEVALEVVDAWQHHGVGRRLLAALRDRAASLGYDELHGEVLLQNTAILSVLNRTVPRVRLTPSGYGSATAVWTIREEAATPFDAALAAFDPLRHNAPWP